jgi:FMN phosphatase YigB (HAD superfamily)
VLGNAGVASDEAALEAAHAAALAAYKGAWERNEQFRSAEATAAALQHLGLAVSGEVEVELAQAFHTAGLESTIHPTPGAAEVLEELQAAGIRTGLVCDIGLTPSTAVRHHLDALGLLTHLDVEAWSDEVAAYKPSPVMFEVALHGIGVEAADAAFVGDRRRTDIAGARAAGMHTVRYRGIYDDPEDLAEADHVIDDLRQLLDLLDSMGAPDPSTAP